MLEQDGDGRMTQLDVLHGPFDVETHKRWFRNYLELVIAEDGTCVYACPSHQRVLERLAQAQGSPTEWEAYRAWLMHSGLFYDYDEWLMELTGAICVWTCGHRGVPNKAQEATLEMLRREGLLKDGKGRTNGR